MTSTCGRAVTSVRSSTAILSTSGKKIVPRLPQIGRPNTRLAAKKDIESGDANPFVGGSQPTSSSQPANQPGMGEAKLEALESAIRRGKKSATSELGPRKAMQIRGVNELTQEEKDAANSPYSEWKAWSLFPVGWDAMPFGQKLTELWVGRRGILFWANKLAYASVFTVLFGWVVFRFVLPALGVYRLAGDLMPPPL